MAEENGAVTADSYGMGMGMADVEGTVRAEDREDGGGGE